MKDRTRKFIVGIVDWPAEQEEAHVVDGKLVHRDLSSQKAVHDVCTVELPYGAVPFAALSPIDSDDFGCDRLAYYVPVESL